MGDALMRTAILLFLVLAWESPVSAAGFDFKGLALDSLVMPDQVVESLKVACEQAGKPCDEFWQKFHNDNAVKCGAGHQGKQVCNGRTSIAGEKATANVVIGSGGRLERVWLTISNYAYESVLAELTKKYGKPSAVKRYGVQNSFGAVFIQVDTVWNGVDGQKLSVSKYAGNTEESTVYFSSRADRAVQSSKKETSGDL
ncbi:hypothetical protein [Zoogloea sp. 1C4]|uniref:hypothetical protein n=1 Tax=Zoogloea sp. 1C4 TaxID=2570190 RepID=UPI001291801A|nr:hypothetical protein [Zoogloea sp. 1C4]